MKYIIGLDCGIASVGWSVVSLENNQIVDFGIRTFPAPEDRKLVNCIQKQGKNNLLECVILEEKTIALLD